MSEAKQEDDPTYVAAVDTEEVEIDDDDDDFGFDDFLDEDDPASGRADDKAELQSTSLESPADPPQIDVTPVGETTTTKTEEITEPKDQDEKPHKIPAVVAVAPGLVEGDAQKPVTKSGKSRSRPVAAGSKDPNKILDQLEADAINLEKPYTAIFNCFKCAQKFDTPPSKTNLPKLLTCLHILCSRCIMQGVVPSSNAPTAVPSIKCPFCQKQTLLKDASKPDSPMILELKTEPLTIRELRKKKAVGKVPDHTICEFVCGKCTKAKVGRPLKPFLEKGSSVDQFDNPDGSRRKFNGGGGVRETLANQKPGELNLNDITYCEECDVVTCLHCAVFGACRHHNMEFVQANAEDVRTHLHDSLEQVEPTMDYLVGVKNGVATAIKFTQYRYQEMRGDILNLFDELTEMLLFREEELLRAADKLYQTHLRKLTTEKKMISENILHTSWAYKYSREISTTGTDIHAVDLKRMMFDRLFELSQMKLPVRAEHPTFGFNTSSGLVITPDILRSVILNVGTVIPNLYEGKGSSALGIDLGRLAAVLTAGTIDEDSGFEGAQSIGGTVMLKKKKTRLVRVVTRNYTNTIKTTVVHSDAAAPSTVDQLPSQPTHLFVCIALIVLGQILHSVFLSGLNGMSTGGDSKIGETIDTVVGGASAATASVVADAALTAEVDVASTEAYFFMSLLFLFFSLCVVALTVHDTMTSPDKRYLAFTFLESMLEKRRKVSLSPKAAAALATASAAAAAAAAGKENTPETSSDFTEDIEEYEEECEDNYDMELESSSKDDGYVQAAGPITGVVGGDKIVAAVLDADTGAQAASLAARLEDFKARRAARKQMLLMVPSGSEMSARFMEEEVKRRVDKIRALADVAVKEATKMGARVPKAAPPGLVLGPMGTGGPKTSMGPMGGPIGGFAGMSPGLMKAPTSSSKTSR